MSKQRSFKAMGANAGWSNELFNLVAHSLQEGFCADHGYPRALKLRMSPRWRATWVRMNEMRTGFKPLGTAEKKFKPQRAVPNRCHTKIFRLNASYGK
jgi:hypothetical protein